MRYYHLAMPSWWEGNAALAEPRRDKVSFKIDTASEGVSKDGKGKHTYHKVFSVGAKSGGAAMRSSSGPASRTRGVSWAPRFW